jgi:hypothetical protein
LLLCYFNIIFFVTMMKRGSFVEHLVDPILYKIYAHGMHREFREADIDEYVVSPLKT